MFPFKSISPSKNLETPKWATLRLLWRTIPLFVALVLLGAMQPPECHGQTVPITATGPMDGNTDGLFVLNPKTGDLKCFVPTSRGKRWSGQFKHDVSRDLGRNAKSRYAIVIGPVETNESFAQMFLYACDLTSGNLAAYAVPWNRSKHAAQKPQSGAFKKLMSQNSPVGPQVSFATGRISDTASGVFLLGQKTGKLKAFVISGETGGTIGIFKSDELKKTGASVVTTGMAFRYSPFPVAKGRYRQVISVYVTSGTTVDIYAAYWDRRTEAVGYKQEYPLLRITK